MIPVVERGVVDGVTVLRSDSAAGRNMAALVFRVGRFDETLPISGITHMVEHLTFAGKPRVPYGFNASVGGRYTTFFMESANPADVRDFVGTVCNGLAADQSAVIDRERRVLRTEAASRGGLGPLGTCLAERYGASGPGIVNYQEFGLHHLGWADVERWRRHWFTAGNAVLWVAGSIPAGLRISLPPSPAMSRQELHPLRAGLPGFVVAGRGGIGMSLEGPRSVEAYVTLEVLQQRLTQVLRHEYGLTYDVQRVSEDLGRDLVHTWIAADALPEQMAMAAHSMLNTFESLAERGCDIAEIEDCARRLWDAYESPAGPVLILQRRAHDILNGRPERDPSETLRAAAELDAKNVREAARAFLDQMIVVTPGVIPAVQGRMSRLPIWSTQTITGTNHKSSDSDAFLTTGSQGVMLTVEPGRQITVRYDSVAALLRWNDGRQALVGTDGFAVQLDPDEWPGGKAVLDSIAVRVNPDLMVSIDAPGSPRPGRGKVGAAQLKPAAPESATRKPATEAQPRRPSVPWSLRVVRALWIVLIIFGVLAIAGGDVSGGLGFAVIGGTAIFLTEYRHARQLRRRREPRLPTRRATPARRRPPAASSGCRRCSPWPGSRARWYPARPRRR